MKYKKTILVFVIVTIIVVALLFAFSYAFYVGTANQNTSFNATKESNIPAVVFAQSSNVNVTTGIPLTSDEVAENAAKTSFTITYGTDLTGKSVAVKISISNIVIDNMLKDSSFKYALISGDTTISSGNFSSLTSDSLVLMASTDKSSVNKPTVESYELRIWIEEICSDTDDETTCSDYSAWQAAYNAGTESYPYNSSQSTTYGQSRMMNKSFSGKIKVTSMVR